MAYASNYLALLQLTWLSIPLWIYWRTWTLWGFFSMGNTLLKLRQVIGITYKRYSWRDNHLVRCLPQGDRVVPPPHEQPGLIQKVHSELGHFGIRGIIAFSLSITIGNVCMFKSKTSLLGVNSVINWELSPFNNSHVFHSLFKACSIAGDVI